LKTKRPSILEHNPVPAWLSECNSDGTQSAAKTCKTLSLIADSEEEKQNLIFVVIFFTQKQYSLHGSV
jgi:hypothetical protein